MTEQIPAPIHSELSVVTEWLDARGAARLADSLRYSVVFSEQSFAPGTDEIAEGWQEGAWISWLGGPAPLEGDWPRNAHGQPLAHVALLHLGDVNSIHPSARRTWPEGQLEEGLPHQGYLQIFHDLQTYGWEADDQTATGWLVRWIPEPASAQHRWPLVDGPEDLDTPSTVCQPGLFMPSFTLPSSLEHQPASGVSVETHDQLLEDIADSWALQRGVGSVPAFTHVYGHSTAGDAVPEEEILPEALPVEAGDRYRLVVEIESWTTLAGWFGDAAALEVWMRESDLTAARFDRAWCIIRTDH